MVDRPQTSVRKVGVAIEEPKKPHFIASEERDAVRKLFQDNSPQNLVHVSFYGRLPDQRWFIDMEVCTFNLRKYIRDLGKRVKDEMLPLPYRVKSGPLTVQENVWDIMKQISSGVAFMHTHNHIHRDIKPENSTQPPSTRVDSSIILHPRFALEDWGFCSCFATLERWKR